MCLCVTEKRPGICDVEISEKAPATMYAINSWEQVGWIMLNVLLSVLLYIACWLAIGKIHNIEAAV